MTEGEPRTLPGSGNGRPSSYISRIHLEVIAILLPIFVVLVAVGWNTRPQSNGFSGVPAKHGGDCVHAGSDQGASEVLHRTADNGAVLDITVGPPGPMGAWTVDIDSPNGAQLCTPSDLPAEASPGLIFSGRPHVSRRSVSFLWDTRRRAELSGQESRTSVHLALLVLPRPGESQWFFP